jgi:hypothetical protein
MKKIIKNKTVSEYVILEKWEKREWIRYQSMEIPNLLSEINSLNLKLAKYRKQWDRHLNWIEKLKEDYPPSRGWKKSWGKSEYSDDGYNIVRNPEDRIFLIRKFEHEIKTNINYLKFAGQDPIQIPSDWNELEKMQKDIKALLELYSIHVSKKKNKLIHIVIKKWANKLKVEIPSLRLKGTTSKDVPTVDSKKYIKLSDLYYAFKKKHHFLFGKKDDKEQFVGLRYEPKTNSVVGVRVAKAKDVNGIFKHKTCPVEEMKLLP